MTAVAILIVSLLVLILIGIPIAFALLGSSIILILYTGLYSNEIVVQQFLNGADSFSLLAVPFFILAGELMNSGGISQRIINFAMSLVGHLRGGMGYVAIVASVLFAGLSGSAVADTAALGAILIPMMVKAGYDRSQSTGVIAAGGIIAPIIPPSIPLIIFGVSSGVSITALFTAGIVPGLMMGIGLIFVWFLLSRRGSMEAMERKSFAEMFTAFRKAIWAILLPIFIIVGLRGGIFTPTEAGAIASLYAFVVGLVIYRELKLKDLYHVFISTGKLTAIVMFLVAAAEVSSWIITVANIPAAISEILQPLIATPFLLLIIINIIVLIIGTMMDSTPSILILTPILLPLVTEAGIDPVYFGIIFVLNLSIGLLTPPVGTVLNVASSVGKISMGQAVKGLWPFLMVHLAVLILLIIFPGIVLGPLSWFE